ncbi:MAG TPA: trigger factor [Actinomycetota bacterium]|nr:trigger factor [Actinomycetota bacterium]
MESSVEVKGPTQVQLNIEVPVDELKTLKADTLKRLANEIKVPGFRKGKVPPQIMESRIGKDNIRQEMLADAVPQFYNQALQQHKIAPLNQPEINIEANSENEPLQITATVDVRPDLELPDYKGIEVRAPSPVASEEDVNNQLERIRDRNGVLEPIGRDIRKGDYVTIDMFGFRHGEPLEGAQVEDFVYEVGSARFLPKMDDELIGKRAGDIIQFNSNMPRGFGPDQEEGTIKVVVKQVQMKRLPELNDEFAKTASEFDTLEELKADIRQRISGHKKKDSDSAVRNLIMDDLLSRTEVPLPESMVMKETELRLARFIQDLERSGISIDEYLEAQKMTREELIDTYKETAKTAVSADLILESVAKAEGMEVTPEELQQEIETMAEQMKTDPETLAETIGRSGSVTVLAGDILRRKALDFLVENAVVLDEKSSKSIETVKADNS